MGIRSQKIVQNSFKKCQFLGSIFESFVGGFGALWVCLGSLFGSLEVFLGGLLIQKTIKNCGFFNVFENACFLFFEDPVGCFGLILLLFVRSGANASAQIAWSKMGFKIKKIALTVPSQKALAFKQRLL